MIYALTNIINTRFENFLKDSRRRLHVKKRYVRVKRQGNLSFMQTLIIATCLAPPRTL